MIMVYHNQKGSAMASIAQKQIFGWKDLEILGDLERLILVLENMPDESLMEALEKERGKGRDEYPIRAVWNSILAGIVFQHSGIESLRRELLRNGQLCTICGFDALLGMKAVPPSWAYTRFLKNLIKHQEQIDTMFETLVSRISALLPDFGTHLAIDGKHLKSHGKPVEDEEKRNKEDGRRDTEADWGMKTYGGTNEDGSTWEKVKSWFGFKLHLIVDSTYELPVMFKMTKASVAEQPIGLEMIKGLSQQAPAVAERAESLSGDRGYDDTKIIVESWDNQGIKPIIDIRNCWKDGETTRVINGTTNVVYDYKGTVSCICMKTGTERPMAFGGFEKDRESLKYLCSAQYYGMTCEGQASCPITHQVRIPLDEDRRIFTPVARSSLKWERMYDMRTAVERVNSRIDNVFCFEKHFIRGEKKMRLRVSLALTVMLAMACGRIEQGKPKLLRSLLKPAA
jgi:hypothetical protein